MIVNAVNSESFLPRAMIIVLDDDLINYLNINSFGMSVAYGRVLHYLFSEVNRLVAIKKDFLWMKSKKSHYPEIIWVNPPFHRSFRNNTHRNKFSKALDATAAIYSDNWSLKLKCIWTSEGQDLFLADANRYTSNGLLTYWMAVDRTIKFWDTALSPLNKMFKKKQTPRPQQGRPAMQRSSKFFWKKRKNEY